MLFLRFIRVLLFLMSPAIWGFRSRVLISNIKINVPGIFPSIAESQMGKKISNDFGMEFVYIAPATFIMGSPSDETDRESDERQHRVTLTKGYYMQTTEVTQGQWKAVMGNNPSYFKKCGDNCPVEKVSWDEV
jgi:formylglycine-generating enzyme required for sulfatase activity